MQVQEIRQDRTSKLRELAARFGVSIPAIYAIKSGKTGAKPGRESCRHFPLQLCRKFDSALDGITACVYTFARREFGSKCSGNSSLSRKPKRSI